MPGMIVPNRRPVTVLWVTNWSDSMFLKGRYILRQLVFLTLWRHGVA